MGVCWQGMVRHVRNAAFGPVFHDPGEFPVTTAERSLIIGVARWGMARQIRNPARALLLHQYVNLFTTYVNRLT
jgi:hypothetical protein